MREVSATAPAKVNFTLDILDRRPDGYHEIRSIMQTIDLCDFLTIRLSSGSGGIRLTVTGDHAADAPVDDTNLVCRAVRAVLAEAGIDEHGHDIAIELTKNIPSQAGLGGGSSDAATALKLTERSFDLDLARDTLLRLAKSLGSDVPFFLTGGTCLVEGLGEKVTRIDSCGEPPIHVVICKPNANVSTAAAYAEIDKERAGRPASARNSTGEWICSLEAIPHRPRWNDFEPVILQLFPDVASVHALMVKIGAAPGASIPLLCGSGAAVFCLVDNGANAATMARALKDQNLGWVATARTCEGMTIL